MLGASAFYALMAVWGGHQIMSLMGILENKPIYRLAPVYAAMFLMLVWQMVFCYFEAPLTATPRKQRQLDALRVGILVPLYNEDTAAVKAGIASMLAQTRKIDEISIVDDGSTKVDYTELVQWAILEGRRHGVIVHWTRRPNAGKRHAQVAAYRKMRDLDIFAAVDSDTLLDPRATEEALKGFADPTVMSVASMVLAANHKDAFLTRFMDLWYVALQFTDRSAMSRMGSVLVNYGALAYYRAEVLEDNIDGYLNEKFAGREMRISDDSLLTLYALLRGRTVQQPTSYAFTLMPTTVGQHARQQIRWMRGSLIRSLWRFRYLPLKRFAFWGHLAKWAQYILASFALVAVIVSGDILSWHAVLWAIGIQTMVYYGVMLHYLNIERSDETFAYRFATYLLTPFAAIWATTVLRVLRWYAMLTCGVMNWGTRENVEVTLKQEVTV